MERIAAQARDYDGGALGGYTTYRMEDEWRLSKVRGPLYVIATIISDEFCGRCVASV